MLTGLFRNKVRRRLALLLAGAAGLSSLNGCSRSFWRQQADKDSYRAIGERLTDPRWAVPRTDLTPDPRSRFFDPYDPDKSPLPPDDAAAHQYMHCVNGMKGYKSWHKLGTAFAIENPQWLAAYGIDMQGSDPVMGHSQVKLLKITLPQAMDIACINNRDYQTNIENLYVSALTLTQQRFALGVRLTNIGRGNTSNSFAYRNQPGDSSARVQCGNRCDPDLAVRRSDRDGHRQLGHLESDRQAGISADTWLQLHAAAVLQCRPKNCAGEPDTGRTRRLV